MRFLPGVHPLQATDLVWIQLVTNFTMVGIGSNTIHKFPGTDLEYTEPSTTISCIGPTGLGFLASSGLLLVNLRLYGCEISLALVCVADVQLVSISAEMSTLYGLFGKNILGKSLIQGSTFAYNHPNAYFNYSDYDCPAMNESSIAANSLEIVMSNFFLGQDNGHRDAGGLVLVFIQKIYSIEVQINHTKLYGNTGIFGGNMEVVVSAEEHAGKTAVVIENSLFANGYGTIGGGLAYVAVSWPTPRCNMYRNETNAFLEISQTLFVSNTAAEGYESYCESLSAINCGSGGGFSLLLLSNCNPTYVLVENSSFIANTASLSGGNININYQSLSCSDFIAVKHSQISFGTAYVGGGLSIFSDLGGSPNRKCRSKSFFSLSSSTVTGNTAFKRAGVIITLLGLDYAMEHMYTLKMEFANCVISNNTASVGTHGVQINGFWTPFASFPYEVVFSNSEFSYHNTIRVTDTVPTQQVYHDTVFVTYIRKVNFVNCSFHHNNGTALKAVESGVIFGGNVTISNNSGILGGGLGFRNSYISVQNGTTLTLTNNRAFQGGAIFVLEQGLYLFKIDTQDVAVQLSTLDIHFVLVNNTATDAGSSIFGGNVDLWWNTLPPIVNGTLHLGVDILTSPEVFDALFFIVPTDSNDTSVISSQPSGVCFCEDTMPKCSTKAMSLHTFPGDTVYIPVVTVGQRNGTAPGTVKATFPHSINHSYEFIASFQDIQQVTKECTLLNYTLFSLEKSITMQLDVTLTYSENTGVTVLFMFQPCPTGFHLEPDGHCDCIQFLKEHGFVCDIATQTFYGSPRIWIGSRYENDSYDIILHLHCPFDYCLPEHVNITLNTTDLQCAYNRSGILCGGCKEGLSLALGSSRCLRCSNLNLLLFVAFLAAGLASVALLTMCNLTISEGTINGLIFYANVVAINMPIFFPGEKTSVFTVFIAWINLDLGIQTCLYNGMNMYAYAWLQFLFPIYIWGLVIVMIVSSHYYTFAAKLFSRNAPKVLATLFLLSYAKLLRAVIVVLSFTFLTYSDGRKEIVWLYDGNVNYLSGKHIPLFVATLIVLMFFLIPYTVLLLFVQCIWKSHYRLLVWLRKFKPVFDAYTGPYKDKYRFWMGLLLLARIVLFLAFTANILGDPALNFLLIALTTMLLLTAKWITRGIYKLWILDVLEAVLLLNLGILSATALYIKNSGGNQLPIAYTSCSIALAVFTGVLGYHGYVRITTHRYWRHLAQWFTRSRAHTHELVNLTAGTDLEDGDSDSSNRAESPTVLVPTPVRSVRLTLDENNEFILVED